jgi:hypothetical protein
VKLEIGIFDGAIVIGLGAQADHAMGLPALEQARSLPSHPADRKVGCDRVARDTASY